MSKNKNVKALRPDKLSVPEVKEEVTVSPAAIQAAPADQFLDLLSKVEEDVRQKFSQEVDADDNYLMVQFHIDDTNDAGQVFIKGVSVAEGQNGEGLVIIQLMSRKEYDDILNGKIEGANVISFAGLKSILEQVGEKMNLSHAQMIVNIGEDTGALPIVSGPLTIESDHFTAAVPQTVVYQPSDEQNAAKVLYIQI